MKSTRLADQEYWVKGVSLIDIANMSCDFFLIKGRAAGLIVIPRRISTRFQFMRLIFSFQVQVRA